MADNKASKFTIRIPSYPSDIPAIRGLFTAYALSIGIDLSFQNFEAELASLPGKYASPNGAVLLAFLNGSDGEEAIGCIAVRPLPSPTNITVNGQSPKVCEMKRLYCTPASRGLGVGRALAENLIEIAEEFEYDEMRLDTLPSMEGARKLYHSLGFVDIDAYYETPLEGTIFLSKRLSPRRG
ncbi:related to N-acetyltransferase [Phialocephala subalpina]|uniref:Related to N-acetyltransferase n=1 Tax=Phialocephala subalpina TaxID=576137 RepID=A0A1L7WWN5_9HELO|nr:related to N-acetyltransferase [Phialocephala subalpina]